MKNLYSIILVVALGFLSLSVNAQISEEESGEFLNKEDNLTDFEDLISPKCCSGETVPNLTFFYNPFSALTNHDRIELARERALNTWFNEQYENFKKEIEKQLNKTFPNFEQARNNYYKHVEKNNILSNAGGVKNKYDSKINVRKGIKEESIRDLKLLELRGFELNQGNINNTSYGAFNFNGTPIGDIRTLSQLNALRNQEINAFSDNEWRLHNDRGVEQFLSLDIIHGGLGHYTNANNYDFDILDRLLPLQINHYNSYGSWQRLDLMQLYLNNVRIPLVMIVEINAADFGTASFLENYAYQNRRGGISIFDSAYEDELVYELAYGMSWQEFEEEEQGLMMEAEEIAREERENYIDNLLGSVSDVDLRIQSIIEDLGYSNHSDEANWFNSHHDESDSFYNYLESNNSSPEAINFARAATEALRNDGAVDFNNEFIKAKSFIGTPADCVLNALISSGNNLFKSTSEAFTQGKSKYRIKFTTFNNPSDLAIATTSLPDPFDVIDISFNLARINKPSMELATFILHETIHAELHRIKLSNNAGPNPLPTAQYNWYVALWEFFENDIIGQTATSAEHTYMANYFINPIASGLREFDENTHPLENYKYFAWTGLQDYGKLNEYITQSELTNLAYLSQTVTNDTHTNPCD